MKDFIHHIIDSWIFMVSIELLLLPLSIRLAKRLKIIENIDIYDNKSNFNPFSFNTRYQKKDNDPNND